MKFTTLFVSVGYLATIVSAQTAIVSITSPLSNTNYKAGSEAIISWVNPSVPTISQIVLAKGPSTGLQPVMTIATNVDAKDLRYTWKIPDDLPDGTDYAFELGTSPDIAFTGQFTITGGNSDSSPSQNTTSDSTSNDTAISSSSSSASLPSSVSSSAPASSASASAVASSASSVSSASSASSVSSASVPASSTPASVSVSVASSAVKSAPAASSNISSLGTASTSGSSNVQTSASANASHSASSASKHNIAGQVGAALGFAAVVVIQQLF
ncbi:unnamed protein product [Rhizopus stolonifer]